MLTQERLKELLDYDPLTGIFSWRVTTNNNGAKVGDIAGCDTGEGYLSIQVDGRLYLAHRLAWLYAYGDWPPTDIDHKNRVRASNQISNLRAVTRGENLQNSSLRSDNTSGVKGVHWAKERGKWAAAIQLNGRSVPLGRFDNIFEAVCARKTAEIAMHPFRVV